MEKSNRKILKGTVVSSKMTKAVVVKVEVRKLHPKFKKYFKVAKKYYARDEKGECKVGDVVEIVETRPLSKLIRWRVREVVKSAVL